jgi:hypothetical protein
MNEELWTVAILAAIFLIIVSRRVFLAKKRRAIAAFRDYKPRLEVKDGCTQALAVFDQGLKLLKFYGLTKPEETGYSDILEFHKAAVESLRRCVEKYDLRHEKLKRRLDVLPMPRPDSPAVLLVRRAHFKDRIDAAWHGLEAAQTDLLALKTRIRYDPPKRPIDSFDKILD